MNRKTLVAVAAVFALCFILVTAASAAQGESFGTKVKNFWRNLIGYPGRVTEESASVVVDATKSGAGVVGNTTKRLGEVTTGDVAKTKELITEPITGTAETLVKAGEGTIKVPSEALKEKEPEAARATETAEKQ
jgi:hypothetical protein